MTSESGEFDIISNRAAGHGAAAQDVQPPDLQPFFPPRGATHPVGAPSSESSRRSNARAVYCTRSVLGSVRRSTSALLLGLLLLGFAAGAQAQTLSISAPADADEADSGTRDLTFRLTASAQIPDHVPVDVCFSGTRRRST